MKTRIYVTESDIAKGCRGHNQTCPVARAIGRKLKKSSKAKHHLVFFVGRDLVMGRWEEPKNPGKSYGEIKLPKIAIKLPEIAKRFINEFDNNTNTVKRFNFRLDLTQLM